MNSTRPRICFISTSNYAFEFFLKGYIERLAQDHQVTLVSNSLHGVPEPRPNITFVEFPFRRNPSPLNDLLSMIKLWLYLRREKFDFVYSISPKGGLLGATAAFFARVPQRVHFFTGQVWVTKTGLWRWILRMLDTTIGKFCSCALVDSPSQRSFLIDNGVLASEKSIVLGSGSVAGVDCDRFTNDEAVRREMRQRYGLKPDDVCCLFLGRLNRDKGVVELVKAFSMLSCNHPHLRLMMVGLDEGMLDELTQIAEATDVLDRIFFTGGTKTPERFFQSADFFCLPSYREGFGIVALEAAACGLPAVVSDIYGLTDAVTNGETGLLHQPHSVTDLAEKIEMLLNDCSLRDRLGNNAQIRARSKFSRQSMIDAFLDHHHKLLDRKS